MSDLCKDLMVEIFLRLPAKSLVRFRSLSKWYCLMISSPDFIRKHTLRSPQKMITKHSAFTFDDEYYTTQSTDQWPLYARKDATTVESHFHSCLRIIGSFNGILCLLNDSRAIQLWNPSIRRKVDLPDLRTSLIIFSYSMKNLTGIHNWKSPLALGFGCVPDTNEYKVASISTSCSKHDQKAVKKTAVYSTKTSDGDSFWIEAMKDTSWVVVYEVKTMKLKGVVEQVVQLSKNGNLLVNMYDGDDYKWFKLDRDLIPLGEPCDGHDLDAETYQESLALLNEETTVYENKSNCKKCTPLNLLIKFYI